MSTWLEDIIESLNNLDGHAHYSDLYPEVKRIRKLSNSSWPQNAEAAIRKEIETHSSDSKNFRGKNVFYKDSTSGKGVWGLLPEYIKNQEINVRMATSRKVYSEGIEGIEKERIYITRSRDSKLAEQRKKIDNYTCQVCDFFLKINENQYIIDVHHLNPIGELKDIKITHVDELRCLCPNCHRIAHSRKGEPLTIDEIKKLVGKS